MTKNKDLRKLRSYILDQAIIGASILGLFSYILTIVRTVNYGFDESFIIITCVMIGLGVLVAYRKSIAIGPKVVAIAIIVMLALVSGLNNFGFLVSSKAYIILIPIFLSFVISYKKAIAVMMIFASVYMLYGALYVTGVLELSIDANVYATSVEAWLMDISIIVLVSLALLFVSRQYTKDLLRKYDEVAQKNNELAKYRVHLENQVQVRTEELGMTNEELSQTNLELMEQRNELEKTISKLKETQQKLIESDKMASIGVLTAGVAHEINNPLNFIQSGIYSLQNIQNTNSFSEQEYNEANEQIIEGMNEGVRRISEIVKSLNHFNRQDTSTFSVCEINSIINNCLNILHHKTKGRIEVVTYFFEVETNIIGIESELHQIFMNIIHNAVQAVDVDGIIQISTCRDDKSNIYISIKDNGCGINSKVKGRIFEPFFTTKLAGQGTGLGLSIAYNIIKKHKGSIELSSEEGRGTEFIISLPVNKPTN